MIGRSLLRISGMRRGWIMPTSGITRRVGRFLTSDPSGDNWTSSDPLSWNASAYSNGDPVNDNDPEGLDCRSIELYGWEGISDGKTVGELLSIRVTTTVLTKTIFTEARVGWDDNAAREGCDCIRNHESMAVCQWLLEAILSTVRSPIGGILTHRHLRSFLAASFRSGLLLMCFRQMRRRGLQQP